MTSEQGLYSGFAHSGCILLSGDTGIQRMIVGRLGSVNYSPHIGNRIAMAFIRPEYAERGRRLLVSVLFDLPKKKMKAEAVAYQLSQGERRSRYRKLIPARVVDLPFIRHTPPIHFEVVE